MCWWPGAESGVSNNDCESCVCVTHLTSEGESAVLLGVEGVFWERDGRIGDRFDAIVV